MVKVDDDVAGVEVVSRWAITIVVFPIISCCMASMIAFSVTTSTELVGSSRTRIGASLRNARASEIRWRSPPDRRIPRSPTCVLYPSGSIITNWWALAAWAASMISSSLASGRA